MASILSSRATVHRSSPQTILERPYQRCTRCVMDTTDPDIRFDDLGHCNNCTDFLRSRARQLLTGDARDAARDALIERIRQVGRGRPYDCLIGVSGGVDSTYVAYIAKRLGLRPLAVHVDNGWNSELAVSNIEKALKRLDIDLHTFVIDWEEFRELQVAFLRASTVDGEMPTDHAIRAVMRRVAGKFGVRYILHGRNLSTEGLLPWGWSYCALDWKYIRSVHAAHGRGKLRNFPRLPLRDVLYSVAVQRIQNVGILDLVPYSKDTARDVLVNELDWIDYGGKHYESIYTRFFQGSILPRKFGIDKRKAHLSSLVCTNQVSRDCALDLLNYPPLPPEQESRDQEYVLKKLELSDAEFDAILKEPARSYRDYPNHSQYLLLHANPHMRTAVRVLKRAGIFPTGFAKE